MTPPQLLTHTKRRDFLNCPRYFFHRHEQGLELIAKKPGRRKGTIFGDALQAARDWIEAHPTDLESALQFAHGSIGEAYDLLMGSGAVGDQDDADSLEVERAKMECVVPGYIDRYGLAPRREVEFHLPLVNPRTGGRSRTFDLAGKLDGMEIVGERRARVIEDKLVSQLQRAMIERLPLDAQSSEYVDALLSRGWAAEIAYRHTRWPGINPTKEKVLKTKTNPAETLDEFKIRLTLDMIERADWYFDEQILDFPKVHLDDYRAGRYGVAQMIMDRRVAERTEGWQNAWPMNPSRCWEYGGCEFIPLCTKQPDAIDRYQVVADNQELSLQQTGDDA